MKYSFYSILNKISNKSRMSPIYSESGAQSLYRIVKDFIKEHPEKSDEEVYDFLDKYIYGLRKGVHSIKGIKSDTVRNNILYKLNSNDAERRQIYDAIIEDEKNGIPIPTYEVLLLDVDENKSKRIIMNDTINIIRYLNLSDYQNL